MSFTNRLKLQYIEQHQVAKEISINENLTIIDTIMLSGGVRSRLIIPPTTNNVATGDMYIVPKSSYDEFKGQDGKIAIFMPNKTWHFIDVNNGTIMSVLDENKIYIKKNSEWKVLMSMPT